MLTCSTPPALTRSKGTPDTASFSVRVRHSPSSPRLGRSPDLTAARRPPRSQRRMDAATRRGPAHFGGVSARIPAVVSPPPPTDHQDPTTELDAPTSPGG